jgi:hypothetical protein
MDSSILLVFVARASLTDRSFLYSLTRQHIGFPRDVFTDVRKMRDCCTDCHTLCCPQGHPVGKWASKPAAGFFPHLFYLNDSAIAFPWREKA